MKILKSWLQDHIEETLPSDEKIIEAFTLKSSEVEGFEKVNVGGKDDTVFDLKILPDRAHYMLSHRGVAYDLCAILNLTLKNSKGEKDSMDRAENIAQKDSATTEVKVTIESDLCSRYSALSFTHIKNTTSPAWLKDRLQAIGARSISSIVDATNYVMFDTGQPLHAFDADKVKGDIVVRLAREGEMIELLPEKVFVEGKEMSKERKLTLNPSMLVIADSVGPLALAGVKGGLRAMVTPETTNIILESANFNPTSVRKTSIAFNLRNDSSKRFENEITPYLTEKGISRFTEIIKEISPEVVVGSLTDIYKTLPQSWTVLLSHKNLESVLNYSISENRVKEILEKLGCKITISTENSDSVYEVTPPFERLDLSISEDIIDEIGRVEGLDKIKSIVPNLKTQNAFSQEFLFVEKIKDFFVSKGFDEIQTRSFTNKGDIEVAYPMASDKSFLRTGLEKNTLKTVELSLKNASLLGIDTVKVFEIGKTFPKTGEQIDLCFAIEYVKKIKNKDQVLRDELEGLAKQLESEVGVNLTLTIVGNYGYIKNLERINTQLTPASIALEKGSRNQFIPFSSEPFIVRDIALFVPAEESVENVASLVKNTLSESAGKLFVKGPDLFDQFEKEGKKSFGFRMVFQADDHTLTDAEVNIFMDKLYSVVKEKGWQVR